MIKEKILKNFKILRIVNITQHSKKGSSPFFIMVLRSFTAKLDSKIIIAYYEK